MNIKNKSYLNEPVSLIKISLFFFLPIFIYFFFISFLPPKSEGSQQSFRIEEDDRYELVNKSAEYTIIEYFDLDCHYCRDFHFLKKDNMDLLKKTNLIIRDYPLLNSGASSYKTLLGECVYAQEGNEKWLEYINASYSNFDKKDDHIFFNKLAKSFVSSDTDLERCILDEGRQNKIQQKRTKAILSQLYEIPTFIVLKNGLFFKIYSGMAGKPAIEMLKYYDGLNVVSLK